MQRNKIIEILNDKEVVDFMAQHRHESAETLALRYMNKVSFDLVAVCQLLHLYHKADSKIPLWSEKMCAITARSYEQATSQHVSKYKSGLINGGLHLVDLTSGLGVDSVHFSKMFKKVTSLEADPELFELNRFNLSRLGILNINCLNAYAEDFDKVILKPVDIFYLDPDRRSIHGQRQILLEDHKPNVLELKDKLFEFADQILVKLSPMADISYLLRALPECEKLWVISEQNEVKEILMLLRKHFLQKNQTRIMAVDLWNDEVKEYSAGSGLQAKVENADQRPYQFLFEPGKSIIKSGLAHHYASEIGVKSISHQSHYYLSDEFNTDGFGRWFEIEQELPVQWKKIRQILKQNEISRIQIAKRNFPESTTIIRNRLKIADGGEKMLLFTTDNEGSSKCFLVKRLLKS